MRAFNKAFLVMLLMFPPSSPAAYLAASFGTSEVQAEGFGDASAKKISFGLGLVPDKLMIELSYLNLGKFEADAAVLAETMDRFDVVIDSASAEITGEEISLVGSMPLGDAISLRGRVGRYKWDLKADQGFTFTGFGNGFFSTDGKDWSLGAGLALALGKSAELTFAFDRYQAFETDFDFVNAGISIGF
ncbi:MAG TPA: outer membrane beta-barrel protein [Gammaproteobacteria bacterium]|nr:outer membrane beta-barrel protein [Gammaproteobacteria bacterium]